MCSNQKCPSRLKCHRFTATPDGWQSYSEFKPVKGQKKCEDFWDNKGYKTFKRTDPF